ncbi:MAG: GGDEF domain-containing protein [Actinobacteria bacterium]|nr:GGDEF domain-containing protein [Thermoleophilia bacterium]MCB9012397.1 GGDEF domain-containing protein [Actinomycetota bacterium]
MSPLENARLRALLARHDAPTRLTLFLAASGIPMILLLGMTEVVRPERASWLTAAALIAVGIVVGVLIMGNLRRWQLHAHITLLAVINVLVIGATDDPIPTAVLVVCDYAVIVIGAVMLDVARVIGVGLVLSAATTTGMFLQGVPVHQLIIGGSAVALSNLMPTRVIFRYRDELERITGLAHVAAGIDELTGLSNRRGLAAQAEDVIARVRTRGASVGVLVADVDHFKRVNDVHGHRTGDDVLRMVGAALRRAVPGEGLLVRLGGEEFCAVLPVESVRDLERVGERLRELVGRFGGTVPVTVSVGGVCAAPPPEMTADQVLYDLIDEADRHLYAAKRAGRDRTRVRDVVWQQQFGRRLPETLAAV